MELLDQQILLEQFITFMITGAYKVCLLVTAIFAARFTVRWMDKHIEKDSSDFATWLNNANDLSKGIYYGARWVGVALIAGYAVS